MDFLATTSCPYCGKALQIDCKDFAAPTQGRDKYNGMGEETVWLVECEEYTCPKCNKDFVLEGSIGEYPEGAKEFEDVHAMRLAKYVND